MGKLLTTGVIAERIGVPLHRVVYIIQSRGIKPIARAGPANVYDDAAMESVRDEVRRIDEHRTAHVVTK